MPLFTALIMVMVAQVFTNVKIEQIVHFKHAGFFFWYVSFLNKAITKKTKREEEREREMS